MKYLQISNKGVADYKAFTLLGVSTTRYSSHVGSIGQFGSGSKHSIGLLLRHGLSLVIYCGKLRMEFFSKIIHINGGAFNQVFVKYSGTDSNGDTNNRTEDLGFVLEWGVQDWNKIEMVCREFTSNAIDGSISAGESYKNVEFKVVEKTKAKAEYTSVFIEYSPEIAKWYSEIGTKFLHFSSNSNYLDKVFIPKRNPDKTDIFKKGVNVCNLSKNGIFDYNLGNELLLDESRNAKEYQVKNVVATHIRNSSPEILCEIFKKIKDNINLFESDIIADFLTGYGYVSLNKENWNKAFDIAFGPKAVACSNNLDTAAFIQAKGLTPVVIHNSNWYDAFLAYGIRSDKTILSVLEVDGKQEFPTTEEMNNTCKKIHGMMEDFGLTNGKNLPPVKAFKSIMDGGTQCGGLYKDGTVYLQENLSGKILYKVALEELSHHYTGSVDGSRDLQDFLFRAFTEVTY